MAVDYWYENSALNSLGAINQASWMNVALNQRILHNSQESSTQLRKISELEEQALSKQSESNELLHHMGDQFSSLGSKLQDQSDSLSRVEKAANNITTRIKEQTGEIAAVRSEIEALRIDQAYQSFAMWRQSEDGQAYLAWAKQAEDWLTTVEKYMKWIDEAYAQDAQNHIARVLDAHKLELTEENYYQPRKLEKPSQPEPPEEPKPELDHLDGLRIAIPIIGLISASGLWIYKMIKPNLFIDFWHGTLNIAFLFLLPLAIIGGLYGLLRYYLMNWSDQERKYSAQHDYANLQGQYEHRLEEWKEECNRIERAEEDRKSNALKNLQADRDRLAKSAIEDYRNLEIGWVKQDVVSISEKIKSITDIAMFRPPSVNNLPDLPQLEPVDTVVLPEDAYQLQFTIACIYTWLDKDSLNLQTYRIGE